MKILTTILLLLAFMGIKAQIPNVSFMEYTYQSNTCNGFKYGSGSLIFIPADAFVMEDGSACKGTIKVKYREFHTQADMVVAGLNMLLKRNAKDYVLESAGMFELRAECNGKQMRLADGVTIQVRMICRRRVKNVEAFVYDEKQRRWLDNGKVYDFSYSQQKPKNDDALWGSSGVVNGGGDSVQVENVDAETGQPYVVTMASMYGFDEKQLPDGFFQGMDVKTLGFYNYDGVINDIDAIPMVPEFVVNTGEAMGETIYVAYPSKNSVVSYYADDFAERFVLLNTKGIKIFTKLKDGSFATLKEGFLDKANIKLMKGTKQKFVLDKQPIKPKTKDELASVTKISNK